MHYEKSHPVLKAIGVTLLLLVLAVLCWLASAQGDLLPGFLSLGAVPVDWDLGDQLPAGSLAIFQRGAVPALGRAAAFESASGTQVGWVTGEAPLTVAAGANVYTVGAAALLGAVRWSVGYLGSAVLFLQDLCWLVYGFTALILAGLIAFAATAKRRRHNRKVKRMLETFERTARRYESDGEDF